LSYKQFKPYCLTFLAKIKIFCLRYDSLLRPERSLFVERFTNRDSWFTNVDEHLGVWVVLAIFEKKTAVFGCLTNALAPPPIARESCSTAQTDRPV